MKKKKLIGKLSLEKSKISNLGASKIMGGTLNEGSLCGVATDCFCATNPNNGCNGSNGCSQVNCGTGGSECKCL